MASCENRFRGLGSVVGAVVFGAAGLAVVLFLLSGADVEAGVQGAAPPTPSRIRPRDGEITRTTTIEFAWEAVVGAEAYVLQLGGDAYTLTATSYVTGPLPDATYGWAVKAINDLGEESAYGTPWTLTVDTVPPPRPRLLTPPGPITETRSSEIDFSWTGSLGAQIYRLRVGSQVYTTAATSRQLPLADGEYLWSVQAVDAAGNTLGYTDTWTVIIDTMPPPLPPLALPADMATVGSRWVRFEWDTVGADSYDLQVVRVNPPGYLYEVNRPDGATYASRELPSDGMYTWTVRSLDYLGNESAYSPPRRLYVDTTPPPVPTLLSPDNGSITRTATIVLDWNDVPDARWYYLVLDGVLQPGSLQQSQSTRQLSDGAHTWAVRAVDLAGNQSAPAGPWAVTVDTLPPQVAIDGPAAGTVLTSENPIVTIWGSASDTGIAPTGLDRVEVDTGDGDGWQEATGTTGWSHTWAIPPLDLHQHTLRVRATDRAGNSTERSVQVTVDTLGPTAGRPQHDQGTYVNGPVIYSWSIVSGGADVLDYQMQIVNTAGYDGTWRTTTPLFTFNGATDEGDEYRARVRARDQRGNWGAWSDWSDVVIPDLTDPVISHPRFVEDSSYLHPVLRPGEEVPVLYYTTPISASQFVEVTGIADGTGSRVARVTFSSAFGETPVDDLNISGYWTSSHPPNYGYVIDPGERSSGAIVVTAYDAAGNTDTVSLPFELDETPPVSSADAPDYETGMPIRVTWDATDTQCGVGPVQLYYNYIGAVPTGWQPAAGGLGYGASGTFDFYPLHGDGEYQFATLAEDVLGNQEAGPLVVEDRTIYDTARPSSRVTEAPERTNQDRIAGMWEATPSLLPITAVDLYYRVEGSQTYPNVWTLWGALDFEPGEGQVTGSFEVSALEDGAYYFATVASDGPKQEPLPQGAGDKTTVRDSSVGAPSGVTLVPPEDWSQSPEFEVVWTHPADLSEIVAVHYRLYESGVPLPAVRRPLDQDDSQVRIVLEREGQYLLWLWLEDEAGNVGTPGPAVPQTVLRYDESIGRPIALTVRPDRWSRSNQFVLSWTNPDEVSGIAGAFYKVGGPPVAWDDGEWEPGSNLRQITVQAPDEGQHTVYVWLKDAAGNVDHRKWMSATLRFDETEPYDVAVIAPSLSPLVRFEVEWTARDLPSHSGIISYTVEVSGCPYYDWRPWLISTTQTSAFYHAGCADDDFGFRVTAYDRAGNWAQDEGRTRVDRQYVYLPHIVGLWRQWYLYDEFEYNDTIDWAFGPLQRDTVIRSYIWNQSDLDDWYYFEPTSARRVRVRLSGMVDPVDLDLWVQEYVYSEAQERWVFVEQWSSRKYDQRDELVELEPVVGRRYYIRVNPWVIVEPTARTWSPNSYRLWWEQD